MSKAKKQTQHKLKNGVEQRTIIAPLLIHQDWFGTPNFYAKASGVWIHKDGEWFPHNPLKIHRNGNATWVIDNGASVIRVTVTKAMRGDSDSRTIEITLYEGHEPRIDKLDTVTTIQTYKATQKMMFNAFSDAVERIMSIQEPHDLMDALITIQMNLDTVKEYVEESTDL